MNPKHLFQTSLAIALFLALTPSRAADARFFSGNPADIIANIPPPPSDDSPAGMADIETILQVQKDRTPAQVERARSVMDQDGMSPGLCVFGPKFTLENLPRTAAILHRTKVVDLRTVINAAKGHWKRPRPPVRDTRVKPCVGIPDGESYPSGHSAARVLFSIFYGKAMPEYAALFDDDARETMWCRVLGGAHYPTDTQAGRKLGLLLADEMLKNQRAHDAIAEMRAEILAFLDANPDARERADNAMKRR